MSGRRLATAIILAILIGAGAVAVMPQLSGDVDAYLADVMAADWDAMRLEAPIDAWSDDGFVEVTANLLSTADTVPQFLLARHIVHGKCSSGGRPVGIGVFENRRPFSSDGFGAGGLTGSQRRCNATFANAK